MVKWEYKQQTLSHEDEDPDDVMAILGDDGWEIYQIAWDPFTVLCKRPVEEEPDPDERPIQVFPTPDRVVVDEHGQAAPPQHAQAAGVYMGAIFIRKDGWSLGAHPSLMDVAESLWPDEWLVVIHKTTIMSYETYKQQRAKGFIP